MCVVDRFIKEVVSEWDTWEGPVGDELHCFDVVLGTRTAGLPSVLHYDTSVNCITVIERISQYSPVQQSCLEYTHVYVLWDG